MDGPKAADRGSRGLVHLCADLRRCQAEIERLTGAGAAADELDVALDAWWSIVETITATQAKTTKGLRSKAAAVRTVMVALGRDRSPAATALLASLLADLLGDTVNLP
jgi:hypothetical protein